MENLTKLNAVAAIRVSSLKQGLQGDSPEAQREQIERFAFNKGINIKKFFVFIESASKDEQPVQEAIDFCKKKSNDVQLFIIKSIDRFTRGGSYLYDHLKLQLQQNKVKLIDIYGIIGNEDVNTLEHLDISYKWSVYNPTQKSEIMEAERAKDEMRDIMTRMIGAEIRYVRMGYRVRQAPYGYMNQKIETPHGKRVILKAHPKESIFIKKMFKLRCQGNLNDEEIVNQLNKLGFRTRTSYRRDPHDRTKIIGEIGNKPLCVKQLQRLICKPVYAGVNLEKWTGKQGIKANFKGLVSIKTFNQANKGKCTIINRQGELIYSKEKLPTWKTVKKINNPDFPYKRVVMCPHCHKPLYGSASRGKLGKYYPAYHCNKRGHYFRVPVGEFNDTIEDFVRGLDFNKEYIKNLQKLVMKEWNKRIETQLNDETLINGKINEIKNSIKLNMDKIKYLSSATTIKYIEEEVESDQEKIRLLEQEKLNTSKFKKGINMTEVMEYVTYFLEHLEELLIDTLNPLKRAAFFNLIFDTAPTYSDLTSGTPNLVRYLTLKPAFQNASYPSGDPTGTRTPVSGMRIRCPNR